LVEKRARLMGTTKAEAEFPGVFEKKKAEDKTC
jgi:hypothetical protein